MIPVIAVDAFVDGVFCIMVKVVVVDGGFDNEEVEVDTVFGIMVNSVGAYDSCSGVIEFDTGLGVVTDSVGFNKGVIISVEVDSIFFVMMNGVVLYSVDGADQHDAVIGIARDGVAGNGGEAAVFEDEPRFAVVIQGVVGDGGPVAVVIYVDACEGVSYN